MTANQLFEVAFAAIETRMKDFSVFAVDLHRHEWAAIKQELERLPMTKHKRRRKLTRRQKALRQIRRLNREQCWP